MNADILIKDGDTEIRVSVGNGACVLYVPEGVQVTASGNMSVAICGARPKTPENLWWPGVRGAREIDGFSVVAENGELIYPGVAVRTFYRENDVCGEYLGIFKTVQCDGLVEIDYFTRTMSHSLIESVGSDIDPRWILSRCDPKSTPLTENITSHTVKALREYMSMPNRQPNHLVLYAESPRGIWTCPPGALLWDRYVKPLLQHDPDTVQQIIAHALRGDGCLTGHLPKAGRCVICDRRKLLTCYLFSKCKSIDSGCVRKIRKLYKLSQCLHRYRNMAVHEDLSGYFREHILKWM
jgi:hypothetical protein